MKKKTLTDLALLGISMALLLGSCSEAHREEKMTAEMRSFYEMLDPEAKEKFLQLDSEHRKAAMSVTEQYCKAVQECRGIREQAVEQQYQLQKEDQ